MPRGKKQGASKMDAVRNALDVLGGREAKPGAIVDFAKTNFGLTISDGMASNYKSTILKKARKKARAGRAAGAKAAVARDGGISMADIQAVKELAGRLGATKLKQLAEVLAN